MCKNEGNVGEVSKYASIRSSFLGGGSSGVA